MGKDQYGKSVRVIPAQATGGGLVSKATECSPPRVKCHSARPLSDSVNIVTSPSVLTGVLRYRLGGAEGPDRTVI